MLKSFQADIVDLRFIIIVLNYSEAIDFFANIPYRPSAFRLEVNIIRKIRLSKLESKSTRMLASINQGSL